MLNAKLEKQINFYNSKCWEYHNKMKNANNNEISNLEKKYDKNEAKFKEIQKIIESDGKHKIMYNGDQMRIDII